MPTLDDILTAYRAAMDVQRVAIDARKQDDAAGVISTRYLALQSTAREQVLALLALLDAAVYPDGEC